MSLCGAKAGAKPRVVELTANMTGFHVLELELAKVPACACARACECACARACECVRARCPRRRSSAERASRPPKGSS